MSVGDPRLIDATSCNCFQPPYACANDALRAEMSRLAETIKTQALENDRLSTLLELAQSSQSALKHKLAKVQNVSQRRLMRLKRMIERETAGESD